MKPSVQSSNTLFNGLLLGWERTPDGNSTPIWDRSREGHLLTVAPTGSGKGVSCAIPALLSWQGPAIVVDPRGENYAVTAKRRRAMGHIVYRLDPFCIAGNDMGDSLNPMDLIDPEADDFEDNAAVVAQLCMQRLTDERAPYWDERASSLITRVICELFRHLPSRRPTLRDVQDTIKGLPVYDLPLKPGIPPEDQLSPVAAILHAILASGEFASDRTRACIFSTANAHLSFMKSPAVHLSLTDSTILLDDITAGAMHTIYLVIPPDKLVTHSRLLRLWLGVMLTAISRRRRAPAQPTLFLIDEAAQLGEMTELRAALTLMRAYGVRVWTFWQCLSQLQSIYSKDWHSIINNSSVQQFFGVKAPHARKLLHDFVGNALPKDGLQESDQLLFTGNELDVTRRASYLNDPIFKGLASPHPFHTVQHALSSPMLPAL